MENLYKSLYSDSIHDTNTPASTFDINVISKINGQSDIGSLSRYYNINEYISEVKYKDDEYINIVHMNIRSIHKNFDVFKTFLNSLPKPPDVIALTETWLRDSSKHLYSLDGYVSHNLVRTNREHGGITIFIKDIFSFELIEEYCFINDDIEICTVKVKIINTSYVMSVVYRPHSKHLAVNEFTTIISQILSNDIFRCSKSILLGDLNINLLEHSTHLPTNTFLNSMQALNYFPHISRPTRFPDNPDLGQPSLLDQIWTNFTPPSSSGIIHFNLSDHLPIFINITLNFTLDYKHKITFRIFNGTNHNLFTNELSKVDWDEILSSHNTNENFNAFHDKINTLYNECFPIKTKFISTKRLQNPWISSGLLNSIKYKCTLFKNYKLGLVSHSFYKNYRNHVTKLVKDAKSNYYQNFFCNFRNDTKKIWKTINQIRNTSNLKHDKTTLQYNNSTLDKPLDIAEAFNNYFCSIAPELSDKLPNSHINPTHYLKANFQNSMLLPAISTYDTINIIKSLKNKNSSVNEISVKVLKHNSDIFSIPLTTLFNHSISTGTFPYILKKARVIPIPKTGPSNYPKNYRPISNLSIFSKIFESLMKNFLISYLEKNKILNQTQFGFRRNHNTFQALNLFSSDIYSALDNKLSVLSVFIDFSKAFDTVNHKILLDKLYHYGIRGPIHSWFTDYLTNRTQQTVFEGEFSTLKNNHLGVPQGSILGPILFLLYINDISDIFTHSKTILFADDMTLYLTGPHPEQLITTVNTELHQLYRWCISNRLTINTDKTYFMLFSLKKYHHLPPLQINNNNISRSSHIKFLGVTYDDSMTFKLHIENLTLRISRHIALLHQSKDLMPPYVLKCIYYAHIYPLLAYCNPIWCTTYPTYLIPLQLQLKKIVRIITNSTYLEHTRLLFKQTQLLRLEDITKMAISIQMYKKMYSMQNDAPIHNHDTRHCGQLRPPPHRISKYRQSTLYLGPVYWNDIPPNIRNSPSVATFKNKLKQHIISNY